MTVLCNEGIKFFFISLVTTSTFCANIVQVLQNNGHTTLVSLVQQAGLDNVLSSDVLTVFAPTNAAFEKLPQEIFNLLLQDSAALTDVLKYHVIPGPWWKGDMSNELRYTTLQGKQCRINLYNNLETVDGAKITTFDLTADNGMVHVIDSVLSPPEGNIVDIVSKRSDLSTLLAQVTAAGIGSALLGQNLTVFAPTNDAFGRLDKNVLNGLSQDKNLLTQILQYHVVPGTQYSVGLSDGENLKSLDIFGDTLRVHTYGDKVGINHAYVTTADVTADNGVIHIIDHILVPNRHLSTVLG